MKKTTDKLQSWRLLLNVFLVVQIHAQYGLLLAFTLGYALLMIEIICTTLRTNRDLTRNSYGQFREILEKETHHKHDPAIYKAAKLN